jgi:hypothetical protein
MKRNDDVDHADWSKIYGAQEDDVNRLVAWCIAIGAAICLVLLAAGLI